MSSQAVHLTNGQRHGETSSDGLPGFERMALYQVIERDAEISLHSSEYKQ